MSPNPGGALDALKALVDKLAAVTMHIGCRPEDAPIIETALEASKPWPEGVTFKAHVFDAPPGQVYVWLTATHSGEPIPFPPDAEGEE